MVCGVLSELRFIMCVVVYVMCIVLCSVCDIRSMTCGMHCVLDDASAYSPKHTSHHPPTVKLTQYIMPNTQHTTHHNVVHTNTITTTQRTRYIQHKQLYIAHDNQHTTVA